MPNDKVKMAYDVSATTKYKLAMLKAEMRLAGISATETSILEVIIENATPVSLKAALKKRDKQTS